MAYFAGGESAKRIADLSLTGDVADLVAQLDTDPERPLAERAMAGRGPAPQGSDHRR